jgi:hypothetical protein
MTNWGGWLMRLVVYPFHPAGARALASSLRLTAVCPSTARLALATCSLIPQRGPSTIMTELVVNHPIGYPAGLLR